jgi:type III restriction enzyme
MSSMELRAIEQIKIKCARKFFAEINDKIDPEHVKHDVAMYFGKIIELMCCEN